MMAPQHDKVSIDIVSSSPVDLSPSRGWWGQLFQMLNKWEKSSRRICQKQRKTEIKPPAKNSIC